jgi:hypothetical protein
MMGRILAVVVLLLVVQAKQRAQPVCKIASAQLLGV